MVATPFTTWVGVSAPVKPGLTLHWYTPLLPVLVHGAPLMVAPATGAPFAVTTPLMLSWVATTVGRNAATAVRVKPRALALSALLLWVEGTPQRWPPGQV
jgi:hypothetical protein